MKLLTVELLKKFERIGNQSLEDDPVIIAKYFHILSSWTWYACSYFPDRKIFFGFVDGEVFERGTFSLDDLESVIINGIAMERDICFKPCKYSELVGY
jgi:hypothetical protein